MHYIFTVCIGHCFGDLAEDINTSVEPELFFLLFKIMVEPTCALFEAINQGWAVVGVG